MELSVIVGVCDIRWSLMSAQLCATTDPLDFAFFSCLYFLQSGKAQSVLFFQWTVQNWTSGVVGCCW